MQLPPGMATCILKMGSKNEFLIEFGTWAPEVKIKGQSKHHPQGIQALLPLKSPKNLVQSMLLFLRLINFCRLISTPHCRFKFNAPFSFGVCFLGREFPWNIHILNGTYQQQEQKHPKPCSTHVNLKLQTLLSLGFPLLSPEVLNSL